MALKLTLALTHRADECFCLKMLNTVFSELLIHVCRNEPFNERYHVSDSKMVLISKKVRISADFKEVEGDRQQRELNQEGKFPG